MAAASPIPISNGNGQAPPNSSLPATVKIDETALLEALIARKGEKRPDKIKLASGEADILVEHTIREFQDADSANRQFKENIVSMVENWRGTTDEKDFPFENCSNLRTPFTSVVIEQMIARLLKAIFGADLWSKLEYVDKHIDSGALKESNQWWDWELREIVKIKSAIHDALHDVLVTGISTPIASYHHETQFLHSFKEWEVDDKKSVTDLIREGIEQVLAEPSPWGVNIKYEVSKQTAPGLFLLDAVEQQKKYQAGKIIFSLDPDKGRLRADIWKREVTFDGARVNYVSLEDLVVQNTDRDIEKLPFFGVRLFYSITDYRQGLEDGFFIDYGKEENDRIASGADVKQGDYIDREITNLQDSEEGTDSTASATNDPKIRFLEVYRSEKWWVWGTTDADDAYDQLLQPATQVCVWVEPRSKKLLKIERLEDLNKDGKRSGVKFGFIEEPGRFFPMGLAEWVRHMQTLLDAISNMRSDAQLIANVPWGFYKPTAGLKGVIRMQPGVFHPSADPSAVNMPQTNFNFAWSMQDEMFQRSLGMQQAGLSDAATGHPPSKRQSATEVATLASALDLRTEYVLETLLESLRELLQRVLSLYQQYGPEERMFRVGGEEGLQQTKMFKRDRLAGRIQLVMSGNLQQINEQLQRQTAMEMFSLLMNQILMQSGVVQSDTIYAAIKLIAKYSHYNEVPLHKPQTPPESDAPEVEEHQMFAGQKPKGPTPTENFAEHLSHHTMAMVDKSIQWTPEAMKMFEEHLQLTMQMQAAKQLENQQRAAMAVQMAQSMNSLGIRPTGPGGQNPGENMGPGTEAEGVQGQGAGPTGAPPAPGQA